MTSQNIWISSAYVVRIEKLNQQRVRILKVFDQLDHRNYDLVMLYLVGKLFFELEHRPIKISALCGLTEIAGLDIDGRVKNGVAHCRTGH